MDTAASQTTQGMAALAPPCAADTCQDPAMLLELLLCSCGSLGGGGRQGGEVSKRMVSPLAAGLLLPTGLWVRSG